VEQDMVERFTAAARSSHEYPKIVARGLLADEFIETLWPQCCVGIL
jgi:hypothetical protein